MRRTLLSDSLAQTLAQFLGTLRADEESLQKCAEIQSGSANHNRQSLPRLDLSQHFAGLARVFSGSDVASRINKIEQMVRSAGALGECWFCRTNLELTIHGNRIAVHDFAAEALRQRE